MKRNKGFTLIELLVVIGILSILAVALLIAINPAEAQRKARDVQRLKDLSSLQGAIESWINDNPGSSFDVDVNSSSGDRDCATGWLGEDVCSYLQRLPMDPRNTLTQVTDSTGGVTTANAYYYVVGTGGVYNICTYLESQSNAKKLSDDGLTAADVYNVYSSTTLTCP